jgi:hypothetical protein
MFVSDRLVFLQLQKSACTHIANLLGQRLEGRTIGKHEPLASLPAGKLVACSVRNPWDWYVSLWAFGCQRRGGMYLHLTEPRHKVLPGALRDGFQDSRFWAEWPGMVGAYAARDRKEWQELYADSGSAVAFRSWLTRVLSGGGKRFEVDDYPYLPMRDVLGLYTYRFLRMSILRPVWRREAPRVRSMDDVARLYADHNIVDRYIRTEQLEEDLAEVLREVGLDGVTAEDLVVPRRNASSRRDVGHYHDAATIDLVAREERFLIDRFGYAPPEPAGEAA